MKCCSFLFLVLLLMTETAQAQQPNPTDSERMKEVINRIIQEQRRITLYENSNASHRQLRAGDQYTEFSVFLDRPRIAQQTWLAESFPPRKEQRVFPLFRLTLQWRKLVVLRE